MCATTSRGPDACPGKDVLVARLSPTKSQAQLQLDDGYLLALAKQGNPDAYDRLVRRYSCFVRLKASSYFLIGGDSDDLIQEGLVGLYKAVRDFRTDRESLVPQLRGAVHHAPDHHRGQDRHAQQAHAAERLRLVLRHARRLVGDGEPTLDEVLPGPPVARPGQPGRSPPRSCARSWPASRPCSPTSSRACSPSTSTATPTRRSARSSTATARRSTTRSSGSSARSARTCESRAVLL